MKQKFPPAYQEYAANILSSRFFRQMTLAERGLLWSLRLESWINGPIPLDLDKLSLFLGGDVKPHFDAIRPLITVKGKEFTFDDLEEYRLRVKHLSNVRANAGHAGGKAKADLAIGKQLVSNCQANATVLPEQNPSNVNVNPNLTISLGVGAKKGELDKIARLFNGETT